MALIKSEIWDIAKKNFGILLIGALFLIFYFNGCGNGGKGGTTTRDTTTLVQQVLQPIVVNSPYTPQQDGKTVYVSIPQSAQGVIPASTMEGLIAQVKDLSIRIEALGNEYYATKHYQDSITLKDTAGTRVGVVNLKQTVSENTLQSTQPSYQLYFPKTTTVITNTIYPKAKNQVYIGGIFSSTFQVPTVQGGVGLLLKNKKDNIFGAGFIHNFSNSSSGAQVSYYQKIQLKKPRGLP